MRRRSLIPFGVAICMVGIPLGIAQAVPPQKTANAQLQSAKLRDAATDIVLSDGRGAYSASELESLRINTTGNDRLFVKTLIGGRTMELSSDVAALDLQVTGGGETLDCVSTHILFESSTTPDWFAAVGSVGDSVRGWGNVRCYTSQNAGYQMFYNSGGTPTSVTECLTVRRESATELVLHADGATSPAVINESCVADVETFEYETDENGQRTGVFTGRDVGIEQAPYELLLTFGKVQRQKGKLPIA
jgi:hypothetical protein